MVFAGPAQAAGHPGNAPNMQGASRRPQDFSFRAGCPAGYLRTLSG